MAEIAQIANEESGASVRVKLNNVITEANKVDGKAASDHSHTNLPTADEKAALAGTGTPSSSNKYVTENDLPTSSVSYGTELTNTADITKSSHCFKTTFFNKATSANLEIQKADWAVGDWFVIVQWGDGAAVLTPEDSDISLPTKNKTTGSGETMYVECYKIIANVLYFRTINAKS